VLVCSFVQVEGKPNGRRARGRGGRWVSSSGGGVGWVCRTNRRGSRASPRGGRLRAPSPDGATARERSTRGRTRVARPRGAAASVEPGSADSCVRRGCDLRGMIRGAFQHRERERERERGGERERERERETLEDRCGGRAGTGAAHRGRRGGTRSSPGKERRGRQRNASRAMFKPP